MENTVIINFVGLKGEEVLVYNLLKKVFEELKYPINKFLLMDAGFTLDSVDSLTGVIIEYNNNYLDPVKIRKTIKKINQGSKKVSGLTIIFKKINATVIRI